MVDNSVRITLQTELDERQARREVTRAVENIERSIPKIDLSGILTGISAGVANAITGQIFGVVGALKDLLGASVSAAGGIEDLKIALTGAGITDIEGTLKSLKDLAFGLAISFTDTASAYAGFASAVQGTDLEGTSLKVFSQLTSGFASLGIGADEAGRAFVALNQILAKGAFSAEEVRGQLADAVPIALPILAKAAGLSIEEFNQALSTNAAAIGDVNTVIPRFAAELEKASLIAGLLSSDDLTTELGRLESAFGSLRVQIGEAILPLSKFAIGLAKVATPEAAKAVKLLTDNFVGLVAVLGLVAASKGLALLTAGGGLAAGLAALTPLIAPIALGLAAIVTAGAGIKATFAVFGDVSEDLRVIRNETAALAEELGNVAESTTPVAKGFKDLTGVTGDYATNVQNAALANRKYIDSLKEQITEQNRTNDVFGAFGNTLKVLGAEIGNFFGRGTEAAEATKEFQGFADTIENLREVTAGFEEALQPEALQNLTTEAKILKDEFAATQDRLSELSASGQGTSEEFIELTKRTADLRGELSNLPSEVLGADVAEANRALAATQAAINLLEQRATLSSQEENQLQALLNTREKLNQQIAVFNEVQKIITIETKKTTAATQEGRKAAQGQKTAKELVLALEKEQAEEARKAAAAERARLDAIRQTFAIRQQQVQAESASVAQQQAAAESLARAEIDNLRVSSELAIAQAKIRGEKVSANDETRLAEQLAQSELQIALQLAQAEAQRATLIAQLAINEAQLAVEKEKQLGSDEKIIQLAEQRVALAKAQAAAIEATGAINVDTAEKALALQQAQSTLAEQERRAAGRALDDTTANNIEPTQGRFTAGLGVGTPIDSATAIGTTPDETRDATKSGVEAAQEPVVRGIGELLSTQQQTVEAIKNLPNDLRDLESFQGTDFQGFEELIRQNAPGRGFFLPPSGLAPPEEVIDLPTPTRRGAVVGPGEPVVPLSGPQTPLNAPVTVNLTVSGQADASTAGLIESAGREAALEIARQLRQVSQ